ncbi:STAS domain-containing protein [Micromonospora sp. DT178]|uniref:STAS domain-containing protein n=1 Tax=Micromonospora sp. DT178 TaxID=3393436 RepID=UPI003CEB0369
MSSIERPSEHRTQLAEPIMTVALESDGPVAVIAVCGEVDMSTAHLITDLTEQVVARKPVRLVLHLSKVTFFSAHGITALLRAQRAATRVDVRLTLRDAAPCVTRLLTVAHIRMDTEETTVPPIIRVAGDRRSAAPGQPVGGDWL